MVGILNRFRKDLSNGLRFKYYEIWREGGNFF